MEPKFETKAILPVSFYMAKREGISQRGVVEFYLNDKLFSADFVYGVSLPSREKTFELSLNPTFRRFISSEKEVSFVREKLHEILLEGEYGKTLQTKLLAAVSTYASRFEEEEDEETNTDDGYYREG